MAASCSPCWAGWEKARMEQVRGEGRKSSENVAYKFHNDDDDDDDG